MKQKLTLILAVALALSLLAGCVQKNVTEETSMARTYAAEDALVMNAAIASTEAATATYGATPATYATKQAAPLELPQNRKWIITMGIEAETYDLDETLAYVNQQINAVQGYVEGQSIGNTSPYQPNRNAFLTIRVPADKIDSFASDIGGIANVISTNRNVQDITLTYSDTEGRVTALETEQKRLLELMEQAENMSDLLEIEGRLTEVRYELETHASRLRLYDNQVDYATLTLYITEVQRYTPVQEKGFWARITGGLSQSFVELGDTIVEVVIWVIVHLPYLVVVALVGWAGFAGGKRIIRKKKATKEEKK